MNIKVGRWVRYKNGCINKYDKDYGHCYEMDFKVADTPQELVQVGDLVELKWSRGCVLQIDDVVSEKSACYFDDTFIRFDEITAIYTPNADKTQYTLQWSVKE